MNSLLGKHGIFEEKFIAFKKKIINHYVKLKKILDSTFTKESGNILTRYWGKFKYVPIIFYKVEKIFFVYKLIFLDKRYHFNKTFE